MSKSTVENAKSGVPVLVLDGRATASLVDPVREAQTWVTAQVEKYKNELRPGRSARPIVVLGIGSGYHIVALAATTGRRIYAVDTETACLGFARSILGDAINDRVELLAFSSPIAEADLFEDRTMRQVLTSSYTLLRHKPTFVRQGHAMTELENWIVGRTPAAFAAHLRLRPEIAAAFNSQRAGQIANAKLVSIKDLVGIWDVTSEPRVERRLFRVLEELVK